MHTRSFRTLVMIAEVGSFAEAAKRLNMTLSAVSMQMKTLEQDIGAELFDRALRPPRLTVKGREIVGHCRNVMAAEGALLKASRPDGPLQGTFHVGFVLSASVRLLPRFLATANARCSGAHFEVETGLSEQLEKKILSGRLDLAVLTAGARNAGQFDLAVLRTEPLVYAMPTSSARRAHAWRAANLPFLHFAPGSGIGRLIEAHVAALDVPPRRTIVLDGMEAIIECVTQGLGFTILPRPDVERYAGADVTIRACPGSGKPLSRDLALVARRGNLTEHQFAEVRNLFDPA